jgi:hypothetical protein
MWNGSVGLGDPTIQAELKSGETLLWSGQPRGGIRFRSSDIFLIPFSLMWGGFAIFWEIMALGMAFGVHSAVRGPSAFIYIFPLWGIPFVVVGLYLMVGRFFVDAKSRERTHYAVTNERVIIVSTLFSRKVQSIPLRQIPELTLSESADGSGTIAFGSTLVGAGAYSDGARRYQPPSFEMIERVREVYDIVQDAQRNLR